MRRVAAEAGWTTGTLVHYFTSKRELLQFTLETSLERRRVQRFDRASLRPAEAIRRTLESALPLDEESRLHWIVTIAFTAQATSDPELAATQRDAYREFRSYLVRLVRDDDESLSRGEATVEAERLIALADGIALQALFDPDSWPPEAQVRALDHGLKARA